LYRKFFLKVKLDLLEFEINEEIELNFEQEKLLKISKWLELSVKGETFWHHFGCSKFQQK